MRESKTKTAPSSPALNQVLSQTDSHTPSQKVLGAAADAAGRGRRHQAGLTWPVIFVWIWIVLTQAQFRHRPVTDLTILDAQVIFQVISWVLLALFAVGLAATKRVDWSVIRRGPLAWYMAFMTMAALSATYSPAPALSLFRASQHITAIVLIASLGERLKKLHVFGTIFIGLTAVLVILGALGINFGLSWITPPSESSMWSFEPVWRFGSAFGHPTQLATIAAVIALTVPLDNSIGGRLWRVLLISFNLSALLLTASRTALAGFAAGLVVVAAARRRSLLVICACGSLVCLTILSESARQTAAAYLTRGQSAEALESFSGRVPIYQDAWSRIQSHWVFGLGFEANRVLPLDERADGQGTVHSHNLILEALSSTGLIGATCACAALFSTCLLPLKLWGRAQSKSGLRSEALLLAAALPPLIGECLTDAGFAATLTPAALFLIGLAARGQGVLNRSTDKVC